MPHHDYPDEVERACGHATVGRGGFSLWALIILCLLAVTALLLLGRSGLGSVGAQVSDKRNLVIVMPAPSVKGR